MIGHNGDEGRGAAVPFRIALLGGKELAIRCLESMLRMPDVDVVAVIPCAGDKPEAGGPFPSLARYAQEQGLRVYQPRSVNEEAFFPILSQLRPDVVLSVFYDKILRPHVLELPTIAAVNVHFGLLPYNRGSFPIPWAIIDGNDPGVTMHYMDPGVDTGDIIAQMAAPPSACETTQEVYDRCTTAGLHLFRRHLPLLLQGRAPRRRQPARGGTYYRPGYPFDRWIDWSQSAGKLSRFVRALTFPPFPSARTTFAGRELEVGHPVWPSEDDSGRPAGTVLEATPRWATIATGDGLLAVQSMRLDGEELPAKEALKRAGCREGSGLEGVSWLMSEVA
jgi:methionyl-tRNA formyltransferase